MFIRKQHILTRSLSVFLVILGIYIATPVPLGAQSTPTIVALGDSLTLGTGSTGGNDWVSVVSRWSGINIINKAISGNTTAEALARTESDVLSYNPNLVIIFLGGNDTLQNIPLDTTILNLKAIVEKVKAHGATAILVATHRDVLKYDVESRIQTLALETDSYYVSRAMQGVLGVPENLSDPVHPNNKGYRIVAEHIWYELSRALNETVPNAPLSVSCEPDTTEARVNNAVNWQSYVWGGASPGNYTYTWSGSEDAVSSGNILSIYYKDTGIKTAKVNVTSGTSTPREVACMRSVSVTAPPLAGYCTAEVDTKLYKGERDAEVIWSVVAAGGTGSYTFAWSGDNVSGTENTARASFSTAGTKVATVTITSGSASLALTCSAQVRGFMLEEDEDNPLRGSCGISPDSFSTQDEVIWSAYPRGESGAYTFEWSGSPKLSGDTATVEKKYNTPGVKTGEVKVSEGNRSFSLSCQIGIVNEPVSAGGGCFIATAAFGSAWDRPVRILRDFRDEVLLQSMLGRAFVAVYYRASPPLAALIKKSENARHAVRIFLAPLVWFAEMVV